MPSRTYSTHHHQQQLYDTHQNYTYAQTTLIEGESNRGYNDSSLMPDDRVSDDSYEEDPCSSANIFGSPVGATDSAYSSYRRAVTGKLDGNRREGGSAQVRRTQSTQLQSPLPQSTLHHYQSHPALVATTSEFTIPDLGAVPHRVYSRAAAYSDEEPESSPPLSPREDTFFELDGRTPQSSAPTSRRPSIDGFPLWSVIMEVQEPEQPAHRPSSPIVVASPIFAPNNSDIRRGRSATASPHPSPKPVVEFAGEVRSKHKEREGRDEVGKQQHKLKRAQTTTEGFSANFSSSSYTPPLQHSTVSQGRRPTSPHPQARSSVNDLRQQAGSPRPSSTSSSSSVSRPYQRERY